MLWIACHFPRLPLETLLRGLPPSVSAHRSWAIVDGGVVLTCNGHARACGIRHGISLSTAYALAPQLEARKRDTVLEAETIARIATWCGQFTPAVALDHSDFCLLDVSGSLKLFGGIAPLIDELRRGFAALGFSTVIAAAPTARGAQLLARAGREIAIEEPHVLAAELGALAVHVLDCAPAMLATLRAVGASTLADCLRLPRAGLARRCGQALLDDLDRALGRLPDPRRWFVPPERFTAGLELPAEVGHAEALVFAARRLLIELAGFLTAHAGGTQRVRLELLHREMPHTDVVIELVAASRNVERFMPLVRERLAGIVLRQPVRAIALYAGAITPLAGRDRDLFGGTDENDDRAQLIERLRARLGHDAVHGVAVHPDHRPERAWRRCSPGEKPAASARAFPAPRPTWLLPQPRPLSECNGVPQRDGPLTLLAGPERIEAGWWDGADVARDYFIARTPGESLLWIYRTRGKRPGWYLHGIFG